MKTLVATLLTSLLVASAHGNTINVPADSTTIQAGISGASYGDTVLVAAGHYRERLDFLGKDIVLASEYILSGDTAAIEGTIIDGALALGARSDTACVILMCDGESSDAVIEGFTIQNGKGWLSDYSRRLGGGIMCIGTSPTIKHNIFTQNSVLHCGGAICCQDLSDATIIENRFTGNFANYGGAIFCASSSPYIAYNEIIGNAATGSETRMGGGICAYTCTSTVYHNTITGNSATLGGGICSYVLSKDVISENEIRENDALAVTDSGYGGGICCYHTFSGTIRDNTIADNSARTGGGGIHLWLSNAIPGEGAAISDNIITGNTSLAAGGGIDLSSFTQGSFTGNLLAENVAGVKGGGASFRSSLIDLSENTIAHNSAGAGGGVWAYATSFPAPTVPILNTILWGNEGGATPQIYCEGAATVLVTYSDVEGGWTGAGNIDCDPWFCDPAVGEYTIDEYSCCVGAGQGGADIGAYGVGCSIAVNVEEFAADADTDILYFGKNRPNPFTGLTRIFYRVPARSHVKLSVYNVAGRRVSSLVDEVKPAGNHEVEWDASRFSAGMYFCRIEMRNQSETKSIIHIR